MPTIRIKLLIACLFVLCGSVFGQYTDVTGHIIDPRSIAYANCTYNVSFVNQDTVPGDPPPSLNGSTFQQQINGAQCDSSGNISVRLADNNVVFPGPSQWKFNICSAQYTNPQVKICFNYQGTITGASQDISTQLQAVAPLLPNQGGGFPAVGLPNDIQAADVGGTFKADSTHITMDPIQHVLYASGGFASGDIQPTGCDGASTGGCTAYALGSDLLVSPPDECIIIGSATAGDLLKSCKGGPFTTLGGGGSSAIGALGQLQATDGSGNLIVAVDKMKGEVNALTDCPNIVGDGVHDDGPGINACLAAHPGRNILLPKTGATNLGPGTATTVDYYSSQTFLMTGSGQRLTGNLPLHWSGSVRINFAVDTAGIVIPTGCAGCGIENLNLRGSQCWSRTDRTTWGNFGIYDGLLVYGNEPYIHESEVGCFNGNGVYINGYCPTWQIQNSGVYGCGQPDVLDVNGLLTTSNRGSGFLAEGGDAELGNALGVTSYSNERWAIDDFSLFGHVYHAPHANGNGNYESVPGGGNGRQTSTLMRASNVVTMCPFTNVSGFTVGDKEFITQAYPDTSFNGGPFVITSVNPGALCSGTTATITAFTIASNIITVTTTTNHFAVGASIQISGTGFVSVDGKTVIITTLTPTQFTATLVSANEGPHVGLTGTATEGDGSPFGTVTWNQTAADGFSTYGYSGIGYNISALSATSGTVTLATTDTLVNDPSLIAGGWVTLMGTSMDGTYRLATGTNASPWTFPLLIANFSSGAVGYMMSASGRDITETSTRSVFDAATDGTNLLRSRSAQASNVNIGETITIKGAGVAGADFTTTIADVINSTSIQLTAIPPTNVTNAQADFGGGWDGGSYKGEAKAKPATWINPYAEGNNGPAKFNGNNIVIGSDISGQVQFRPGIGTIDYNFGSPTEINPSELRGSAGFTFVDTNNAVGLAVFQLQGGVGGGHDKVQAFRFLRSDGITVQGTLATVSIDGGFSIAGSGALAQLYFPGNTAGAVGLRNIYAGSPIDFGNGYARSNYQFWGDGTDCTLSGHNTKTTLLDTGGNLTLINPCPASSVLNLNSPKFQVQDQYWDNIAGLVRTMTWIQQNICPAGSNPECHYKFSRSANTNQGLGAVEVPMLDLTPTTFANLGTPIANGNMKFCSDCKTTTPATCSTAVPAACACTNGGGGAFAKYFNYEGAGVNWYCQ